RLRLAERRGVACRDEAFRRRVQGGGGRTRCGEARRLREMGRPARDHPRSDRAPDGAGFHVPLVVKRRLLIAAATLVVAAACSVGSAPIASPDQTRFDWQLPRGFPLPLTEADNIQTPAKFALGRRLFYDRRLSANGTQS